MTNNGVLLPTSGKSSGSDHEAGRSEDRSSSPVLGAPRTQSHVPALDGIRGLAVLMVMLCHFTATGLPDTPTGKITLRIFDAGWSGVDLFFVLSGFLITGILYDAKGQSRFFRNFYARRFLRIFPLYYGFLILFFWVIPVIHPFTPRMEVMAARQGWLWGYSSNLLMAWEGHWRFIVDWMDLAHFWTLAIEEQFYLLWPLIVFLLSRKALMQVCIACMVAALAIRSWLVLQDASPITVGMLTVCRFDTLAVGSLAALVVRGPMAWIYAPARLLAGLSGGAIMLLTAWRGRWDAADPVVQTIGFSTLGLFCAAILILVVDLRRDNKLARWFSHPSLRWLGVYSYGMYVFHVALRPIFERIAPVSSLSASLHSEYAGVGAYVLVSVSITALAAYLSWHIYEKHFLRLKRHFVLGSGPSAYDRTQANVLDASSNSGRPQPAGT